MIKQLDTVVLTRDLPEHGLKRGDVGAVVLVQGDGAPYGVEFVALDGETLALATLSEADIRRAENEVMHSRTPV